MHSLDAGSWIAHEYYRCSLLGHASLDKLELKEDLFVSVFADLVATVEPPQLTPPYKGNLSILEMYPSPFHL